MGTATRKAQKAMQLRVGLTAIAMQGGPDAQGAKRRHKALSDSCMRRESRNVKGFFSQKELDKTKQQA